ncbi:MAG TPA: 16S rRNA (guanine(527)-N(7))-methyltransferase RsmG [Candidatus Acidoferrales bacterium]|nr:16S rRNA (guanine(527)-N(7))-methyltransferase RsmG [Candidatus Acidoferrales bacterium]
MLTILQIERLLRGYGLAAAPDLAGKVGAYIELLLKWNRKIALTTVTDPEEIVKFHFGESLFATSRYNLKKSRLADVGTGGGFPGLPLALAIPTLSVTLVESNLKKCAFLAEILRELAVRNATIFSGRMEFFAAGPVPFDFITARAFGQFDELRAWARLQLSDGGKLVLWLGEEDAQDISTDQTWSWGTPDLIPGSKRRYVLAGSPGTT